MTILDNSETFTFFTKKEDEYSLNRLNFCLNQLRQYEVKLLIGRILVAIGIFIIADAWLALVTLFAFGFAKVVQDSCINKAEKLVRNANLDVKGAYSIIVLQAQIRNLIMVIIFGTIFMSNKEYSRELATFYLFTHCFTFFFQHASLSRLFNQGLYVILSGIIVASLFDYFQTQSFGELVLVLAYGIGVYLISVVVSGQVQSIVDFQDKLSEQVALVQIANKKFLDELDLRNSLETVAGVGIYRWFFENNDHFWSNGVYLALGIAPEKGVLSKDEFLGRIAHKNRDEYLEKSRNAKHTGEAFNLEFSFLGDDGEFRHIFFHGKPMKDENGNSIGMNGIVVDHTALQNSLRNSTKAQKILQLALRTSGSVVFEKDYAKSALRAFGSIRPEINHEPKSSIELENMVRSCMTQPEQKMVENLIVKAEKTGEIQSGEHKFRYPDGQVIDCKVSVYVEGEPSKGTGRMISITTDITNEIKQRNILANALETAKKANRAKTEFLANMSHEIRTPLNGIIALTNLLSKTKLNKSQKEMLEVIDGSSDTLLALLNDILDLARVESGRLEIDNTEFNLAEALKTSTALFSAKAKEKGLEFVCNIDDAADEKYRGDPNRIKQIISNLVSNSIKFTAKGKVELDAKIIEADNETLKWEFIIQDTGIGIAPDKISKLFERFEQADGSITREHGGSGLGLSICKGLCELMGGQISAHSEFGKGTIIRFILPLKISDSNSVHSPDFEVQSEGVKPAGLKILAADDNEINRKVLELVLTPLEANLIFAVNGDEAVDAFKNQEFDIVLMDLQMPVKDGLSATREIREYEKTSRKRATPIIALSANAMKHHIEEAIEAGANSHVPKPFTPEILFSGITSALENGDTGEFDLPIQAII